MDSVVVAQTVEEAMSMRQAWRDVCQRHGTPSLDADPEFFLRVYKALGSGARPHIVLFGTDGTPCGLIVGRTWKRRLSARLGGVRLRMPLLRVLTIVYGGMLTDGSARCREAVQRYLTNLVRDGVIEMIEIEHISTDHDMMGALAGDRNGLRRRLCYPEEHHVRRLRDTPAGQEIPHHSSKTRSMFRRKDRKLVERFGEVEVQVHNERAHVTEFIRIAQSISERTYQAFLGTGVEDTERWRGVVGAIADTRGMRGYVLMGGGRPIAYVLGAVCDHRFTLLATGFLPEFGKLSPGLVLLNRALDSLQSEQITAMDFGFGDAEYKRLLANDVDSEVTIRIYGSRWRPMVCFHAERAVRAGVAAAKRGADAFGVKKPLRRTWRRWLERRSVTPRVTSPQTGAEDRL